MESPHEQQQSLLLSRIITNIEKLNEAVMIMNKNLQVQLVDRYSSHTNGQQEVNIQNMNVELVAQMFKNYQSNVLFHLEGNLQSIQRLTTNKLTKQATENLKDPI
ncbi:DASH complex subunit dad4 [Exophiala xenobiotica]|uniref:DASH complex subunit DAD4 n=1 Tax=Lithohypha guttulata TaxID=1690604 RepID=A0ABR0KMT1_9EURO|nr:DASH complex subunit dad4 [Lithohypha guttulata]KAK5328918.1 DASH complex subunit dad4 [Exophiala xenobiotica]